VGDAPDTRHGVTNGRDLSGGQKVVNRSGGPSAAATAHTVMYIV